MEGLSTSPAQRMFGRRMWTHLQGALAIGERRDSQSNATSQWQEPETADFSAGAESYSTAHNLERLL